MGWLLEKQKYLNLSLVSIIATSSWLGTSSVATGEQLLPARPMRVLSQRLPISITNPPSRQPPLLQQGSQIAVNGRIVSAAWSQWQLNKNPRTSLSQFSPSSEPIRTGISDGGLMQIAGVELLNTWDATKQPVQWYSQPATKPLILATKLTSQYRYLDITDFATLAGWRLQVDGTTLRIETPLAKVQNIVEEKQQLPVAPELNKTATPNRIIIDLDRPTIWQVSQQGQELTITLDAAIDPVILQRFNPILTAPSSSPLSPSEGREDTEGEGTSPPPMLPGASPIKVSRSQDQTTIRVSIPATWHPHVWSLPQPYRLVIDVQPETLIERDILWAPGLRYRQKLIALGNFRFPVVWLEINLRQPGLMLKPIWGNSTSLVGISPLIQMGKQWQAIAAINGGFFNRNSQLPLGAIRRDGQWLSSPILNRGAIAWNDLGEVKIGRLNLQDTLITSTGERLPIVGINSGYIQRGISYHTPAWGNSYIPLTDNETLVVVQNNQITAQLPGGVAGQTAFSIPPNGYLLVIRDNAVAAELLPIGTKVLHESVPFPATFNRYPQIIGAGPILLENSRVVLDAKAEQFRDAFIRQAAIRSAIGKTQTGNLIFVAVHNRINGAGPTLSELATLMKLLGAVDALNLDGGSSTSLYLGGQLLDRSPLTAARVHNGLGVFLQTNP